MTERTDVQLSASAQEKEEQRLRALGFDGLYHPDSTMACGCFLNDLRPCGETDTGCRGGHIRESVDGPVGVFKPTKRGKR